MVAKKNLLCICIGSLLIYSCKKEEKTPSPVPLKNDVPEFYKEASQENWGKVIPDFTVVANSSHKISKPQDLDFNPFRLNELWIINKGSEATGGSTVMLSNAGESDQTFDYRQDENAWHFMSLPSAIAFSPTKPTWATTPDVLDANHQGGTYTGPSLWSSDLSIYAKPSGANGSHFDMLHGSPYAMGIAAEKDNIFWVFDGYNKHLCRYDFQNDHGPGHDDHSDGKIHRYKEVPLKRGLIPSHMVMDENKKWLYIVNGGLNRIIRVDITTGTKQKELPLINEPLAEHWEMSGIVQEVIVETGLQQPCGIEVKGNRLFVSDYATGEIIAYNIDTKSEIARINTGKTHVTGIKIGPDGKLWFVNETSNELYRIDPK